MPSTTLVREHPPTEDGAPIRRQSSAPTPDAESGAGVTRSRFSRAWPPAAMVSGLVALAVAATVLVSAGHDDQPARSPEPTIAAAASDPMAITLSARDVSVVLQVYEPGEHSGWHAHSGIHAVAVLSGVLTVYDDQCQPQRFEPGRPYVGGQQPHLVRNETDAPVTMAVTYLSPSRPATSSMHLAGPAGCAAG